MSKNVPDSTRDRRVLVFAYYFPPMGLSGVQRTVKFVKYLPECGWKPTVLTCEPGGYFAYDWSLLDEVEQAGVEIVRAKSWDPTRFFGRESIVDLPDESSRRIFAFISQLVFVPDNKIGWRRPARKRGLRLLDEHPFDLVFSTAPPYTAHLAAADVARARELPLVLDFRDDWIGNPRHSYPTRLHRRISEYFEQRATQAAQRVVVINDVIRSDFISRNEHIVAPRDVVVIPQGFDPADFESSHARSAGSTRDVFTLLYSGVFYDVQTPDFFLRALSDLVSRRPELRERIEAVFVGLLPESSKELARELGIQHLVRHTGYVAHKDVIDHLLRADVLWMTVGRTEGAESISTSKLYEYFGTRKPILGLVPDGAAKDALHGYGAAEVVDPYAVTDISRRLEDLYAAWQEARLPEPNEDFIQSFDRRKLARRLAELFDGILRDRREANVLQPANAAEE